MEKKPFYKKTWFMYLMLFIMTPIGLIFLWLNKDYTNKKKAIMTGVFGVWFIVMLVVSQSAEEQREEERAERQEEREQEEKEQAEEEEAEKKEKEEAEKKEEERLKNRDTDEAIEEDNDDVVEAELSDGELTLTYEPGTMWSENSLFYVVYDAFEITHDAFEHDDVDSVVNIIKVEMTDEKGNEELKDVINYRYTRSDFEELNYENFKEMSFGQQWRILNEADGYFIHPGIRANLKDEYINNLK